MLEYKFGQYNRLSNLKLDIEKAYILKFGSHITQHNGFDGLLINNLNSLGNELSSPFLRTFIIRGIGYRAQVTTNNWYNSENKQMPISCNEFVEKRYLSIRVGYSYNVCLPIPNYIGVFINKKNRKVVIYGALKCQVLTFSKLLYNLRPSSVYTGRGIRYKKFTHKRKVGKKDIRKGRFF